jgi:DNA invertase Pin-like site-specific DNA recombinase
MKKAVLYARVSTPDQHVESQLYDLRRLAAQRGFEVVGEYTDNGVSGTKARRLGLNALMTDARKRQFSVVLISAFARAARSTRHLLQLIDELDSFGIQFVSRRENVDTSGPMGRLFLTIIGSIGELEADLIKERIRAGVRRRKLEGLRLGRTPLNIDHSGLVRDRLSGMSLTNVAKKYNVSRASVARFVREARRRSGFEVGGSPAGQHETAACTCVA